MARNPKSSPPSKGRFEKSGHYFFNPPYGRGYDDGIVAAIAVLDMLDHAGGKKLSDHEAALPKTWSSPTMGPYCADDATHAIFKDLDARLSKHKEVGEYDQKI